MRVSWVWIYEDNAEVNVPNSILRRRAHGRDEDEVDAVQSGGSGGGGEEVRISVFALRLHAWGIAAKCRFVFHSWSDIESDELEEPPLKLNDFLKSLSTVRPTVTQEDIRKHDEWTKESGESA